MLKKVLFLLIIIIGFLTTMTLIKLDNHKGVVLNTITNTIPIKISNPKFIQVEQPIGKIIIPKIKIERSLYDINSANNNIEKNITILKGSTYPSEEQSIMFIAAHSGTGMVAFFKDLDKLREEDEVHIIYQNKTYVYKIQSIEEQNKNGYIRGKIEKERQLVLTTCCPQKENCQLIINAIEKES